jgi:hemerythrin-like metal-binding protein
MIVWTAEYDTGIRQIDLQHQELVELINEAMQAHASGDGANVVEPILLRLKTYVLFHFGTEESLLNGTAIPADHAAAHRSAHKQFTDHVADMKRAVDAGDPDALPKLLDYLQNWLLDHILKTDKELAKLIRRNAPSDRRDQRTVS